MKILFLTHSFNGLSQRLYLELKRLKHTIAVEFDINQTVSEEAVRLFKPDLILCPFLKRAIPRSIWSQYTCLIVHPGIKGDRGPSALDWAVLNQESIWGVTILQANEEMDGGDIWAEEHFKMRLATKSSLYRNEVTEAASRAVLLAIERFASGCYQPQALNYQDPNVLGRYHPLMTQNERRINWAQASNKEILCKIAAADGFPGVGEKVLGQECFLYGAREVETEEYQNLLAQIEAHAAEPGHVIAWSNFGILLKTLQSAVWISHLRRASTSIKTQPECRQHFKLPAHKALASELERSRTPFINGPSEIKLAVNNGVGLLYFEFYNGAMSTSQCQSLNRVLKNTLQKAKSLNLRVLVLMGGQDFWSNGIHLHEIEAATSPADESWKNIQAMNDLALTILTANEVITISALRGNAGAGGVFLALAADKVFANSSVILNPHYKSMGNLYGSEYWTYSLPRRVGAQRATQITEARLPLGAPEALELGLIDDYFGSCILDFEEQVIERAQQMASAMEWETSIAQKKEIRRHEQASKALEDYRAEEMAAMELNFFGFDPSYHIARYNFVHRVPVARTPRHLATHRALSADPECVSNFKTHPSSI